MGSGRISVLARRLWRRRGVRQAAFWTGLILQLAMLGAALGLALTPSGDHMLPKHSRSVIAARHAVVDRDGA